MISGSYEFTINQSEYPVELRNYVHPTAIIHPHAEIGEGNYIGPYCIIGEGVTIGNSNRLEAFVSIGTPAEKHGCFEKPGSVYIGNGNVFREFVTVNSGSSDKSATFVGDNCLLLKSSHVGHDCVLKNNITLSCGVKIGGHSLIQDGANLGLNAVCHQFSIIGAYAMIGMGTVITKKNKIYPFKTYIGNPAKYLKENEIAMERNKITREQVNEFWEQYKQMTP